MFGKNSILTQYSVYTEKIQKKMFFEFLQNYKNQNILPFVGPYICLLTFSCHNLEATNNRTETFDENINKNLQLFLTSSKKTKVLIRFKVKGAHFIFDRTTRVMSGQMDGRWSSPTGPRAHPLTPRRTSASPTTPPTGDGTRILVTLTSPSCADSLKVSFRNILLNISVFFNPGSAESKGFAIIKVTLKTKHNNIKNVYVLPNDK